MIERWNIEISGDAAERENFKAGLKSTKNRTIINAKFTFEYYKKLQNEFEELIAKDKSFPYKDELEVRKTLQQR